MEIPSCAYMFLIYINIVSGSDCFFPLEWRGSWNEGRRTEISINSMTRKGTCIQKDGNKYFMLNKDSNNKKCFKCLVFTQWHPNLLQYKESPCWYEQSFQHVCGLINGDAILNTLVKSLSSPQPCPFQGSYTFSYTNGTMSNLLCDSPMSEIRACADESKFKFVFKKCQGIPGTYNHVEDFQCLATWENGDKYLYGSFSEPLMRTLGEYNYRCMMHSFYGTNGDMSMSADSTCQGLQSPTLGVISMKFTKDLNEPRGTCRFPDVLVNRNKWRDLSGKILLEVESGLQVLRIRERHPNDVTRYTEGENQLNSSPSKFVIRCVDKTYQAESLRKDVVQTDYVTSVTDDNCETGYQCVRLVKRDENILEMYLGDRFNSSKSLRCNDGHFHLASKHLLIPDVNDSGLCSITRKGIYSFQDKASECTGKVNIGCSTPNKITIDIICPSHKSSIRHSEKVEILHCLHSWTTDSRTYIIIQDSGKNAKCLTFIDTQFGVELQSDDSCQSDRWTVTYQYLNYLLYNPPDSCVDSEIQADQNTQNDKIDIVISRKDIVNCGTASPSYISRILCTLLIFIQLCPR